MTPFIQQILETQACFDSLRNLFAQQAYLFEHAYLVCIAPARCVVYVHASFDRKRDWKEFARRLPEANWQRKSSASNYDYFDYDGKIDNIEICILQAELRERPQPLFAEQEVVAT